MSNFGDSELSNIRQSLEEIEGYGKKMEMHLSSTARSWIELDATLQAINFNLSELQKLKKLQAGLDPLVPVNEQLGK